MQKPPTRQLAFPSKQEDRASIWKRCRPICRFHSRSRSAIVLQSVLRFESSRTS
ncbi:hypothetical protein Gogos_000701 [Gossypium gossypioides]|uniref:Uncharacterized protein n=1 Tax=Gossypium gossypioides TaxID=34282 RepID=A0A7J9CTH0_GOSGO|nr:hypothetical protein [Gossypium gossypioides]